MLVTMPLLLLLSILIWLMMRHRDPRQQLTWPEFLICGAWGFLLAQSSFAPMAHGALDGFAEMAQKFFS